jgi:hypothetical protein
LSGGAGTKRSYWRFTSLNYQGGDLMANDNGGGVGVLGVLVGALIVIVVGGGLLFATGNIGQKSSTVKVELPKISTTK